MRQEQAAVSGIYFSKSFTAGALSGRLYQMTESNQCPYLKGEDAEKFNAARVAYVVRSSGIVLAWLAVDGMWSITEGNYGKTFARHRTLVRRAIAYRIRREETA